MGRERAIFWAVSGAVILLIAGGLGYLQFVVLRPPGAKPDKATADRIDQMNREAARRNDPPPEPWFPADPWWKQTTIEAFDRAQKGRSWPSARRAVVALGTDLSGEPTRTGDEPADARSAAATAVEFNCDDPMVLWAAGRYAYHNNRGDRNTQRVGAEQLSRAADGFLAKAGVGNGYPAYVRCHALYEAAASVAEMPFASRSTPERADTLAEAAAALLPEVAADKAMPRWAVLQLVEAVGQLSAVQQTDRMQAVAPVIAALEAGGQPKSTVLTCRGAMLTTAAWDARGRGHAGEVTEAGWRGFRRRLAEARFTLTEAWEADNANGDAAARMLTVCMGDGAGRPERERWFERALAADPYSRDACTRRMLMLQPKWGGSVEAMVTFGRELSARAAAPGADPRLAGLPLVLVDGYWDLAGGGDSPDTAVFATASVWEDVRGVYEAYLAVAPNARLHRTRYAVIAGWAGKWDVAAAQFDLLGDEYSRAVVAEPVLNSLREQAARKGKVKAG